VKISTLVMPERDKPGRDRRSRRAIAVCYTYTMVDRPEMADYRSTVAVIPLDDFAFED